MKTTTIQIRSIMNFQNLLCTSLFLGFYLNVSFAQDPIIPEGSTVKKLSSNQFQFLEGPVWYKDSVLLFVDDWLAGSGPDIYKYDPDVKLYSKWPSNSTHCTGLTCDKDGNLIGASSSILLMNTAGQVIKTLASGYNGKPFNGPNDLIADKKGGVYFTDPDFFLTTPPQDKTAVYYVDSTGNVTRVIDELVKPNGLILSPDGTKLYADETENKYLYSWDVAADGSVSGKIIFAELQFGAGSYADGMAVDVKGNIYVAGDRGIQVFSPQGEAITTIAVPERPSNCDFGGIDFKTLFITAGHTVNSNFISNLYSINLNYPGYAVSREVGPNAVNSIPSPPMFEIYPNPGRDVLFIQNIFDKVNSIEVLNMNGEILSMNYLNNKNQDIEINTQKLTTGMYLLRIDSKTGIVTRKFVKE